MFPGFFKGIFLEAIIQDDLLNSLAENLRHKKFQLGNGVLSPELRVVVGSENASLPYFAL